MQDLAITKPKEIREAEHIPVSALVPSRHEWSVFQAMAENAAKTKFAGQMGGPAGILTIMLYARELGIPPMQAVMGGFWNIQGHIEMSARLINMRIREAGHLLKLKKMDYSECVLWGKRTDTNEEMEVSYSMEDARRAGLVKTDSNWAKHPQDMLWARAITRIGRRLFPDTIGNAYVEGEIREVFNVTDTATPTLAPLPEGDQTITEPDETKLLKAEFWRRIKGKMEIAEDIWPETELQISSFLDLCAQHNEASRDQVMIEAAKNDENFGQFWAGLCQHMGQGKKVDPGQPQEATGDDTEQKENGFRAEWINMKSAGYSSYVWQNIPKIREHPEAHDEMREKWAKLYPKTRFPLDPPPDKTEGELQTQSHLDAIHRSDSEQKKNGDSIFCPDIQGRVFIQVCEERCKVKDQCQPYQEHVYESK